MKVVTWNVNSIKVRLPQLLEWLAQHQVDAIALQETKSLDENFPQQELQQAGYHAVFIGQKSYNGVAILSRTPASDVVTEIPDFPDPQRRVLMATVNDVRLINLYVPNGQDVDSDKYQYKLAWLKAVNAMIRDELTRHPQLIVLGDFNIAPDDRDVHDPKRWLGQVLCTDAERQAFQDLLQLGLHDGFRLFDQAEKSFTWWDYRLFAFKRNAGLRIDHLLLSDAIRATCRSCHVDTEPRASERPSDHAPVVVEFS